MSNRYYWRAYCATYLDNADVGMLTDFQFRAYVMLQAIAARADDAAAPLGVLPELRHMAYTLRSSEGEVTAALGALAEAGLVVFDELLDKWRIVGWVAEQPTAGAERKAKHDKNKRVTSALQERYQSVTDGNTEQESESESEQEEDKTRAAAEQRRDLPSVEDEMATWAALAAAGVSERAVDELVDILLTEQDDPLEYVNWLIDDTQRKRPKNLPGLIVKRIRDREPMVTARRVYYE